MTVQGNYHHRPVHHEAALRDQTSAIATVGNGILSVISAPFRLIAWIFSSIFGSRSQNRDVQPEGVEGHTDRAASRVGQGNITSYSGRGAMRHALKVVTGNSNGSTRETPPPNGEVLVTVPPIQFDYSSLGSEDSVSVTDESQDAVSSGAPFPTPRQPVRIQVVVQRLTEIDIENIDEALNIINQTDAQLTTIEQHPFSQEEIQEGREAIQELRKFETTFARGEILQKNLDRIICAFDRILNEKEEALNAAEKNPAPLQTQGTRVQVSRQEIVEYSKTIQHRNLSYFENKKNLTSLPQWKKDLIVIQIEKHNKQHYLINALSS